MARPPTDAQSDDTSEVACPHTPARNSSKFADSSRGPRQGKSTAVLLRSVRKMKPKMWPKNQWSSAVINDASYQDRIMGFLLEELLDDLPGLETDEDLLADGMVDSLGMVLLVAFIEEELHVTVPPEDFIVENFQSVQEIAAYLSRRNA